ncbi:hypothetical protein R1sor_015737 [Riccia sorocarpa]|uniref:Uncharacterized protein n=1 Tax=Riccia sorocarpa TaxID=122646 RepID=A0ABD3HDE2_9MARC
MFVSSPVFILPYPSPGANTVGEAVNSFAIWDISKVYPMPQLPQSQNQEAPEPTPNDSTQVPADEPQSTSRGRESNVRPEDQLFFKVRKNWANVEVTLLSIVESLPIADGIIFLPFSTSCVGEVRVGEQYAGVLVSTVHSEVDPTILDRDLPNFHPDDPITKRWPILHLRIASNGAPYLGIFTKPLRMLIREDRIESNPESKCLNLIEKCTGENGII